VPVLVRVETRPTSEDNNGGKKGMRVLKNIPNEDLQVAQFKMIKGSDGKKVTVRSQLLAVVDNMATKHNPQAKVMQEWYEFLGKFMESTAEAYISSEDSTYRVPLKDLFRTTPGPFDFSTVPRKVNVGVNIRSSATRASTLFEKSSMLRMKTTGSVDYIGGVKVATHPRIFLDYANQALTGPHLMQGNSKERRAITHYYSKKLRVLKLLAQAKGLPVSSNKATLIEELIADDRKNGTLVHEEEDRFDDGISVNDEIIAETNVESTGINGAYGKLSKKKLQELLKGRGLSVSGLHSVNCFCLIPLFLCLNILISGANKAILIARLRSADELGNNDHHPVQNTIENDISTEDGDGIDNSSIHESVEEAEEYANNIDNGGMYKVVYK